MKICGVYKITCFVNGKVYIGSSDHIFRRWGEHVKDLENKFIKNKFLFEDYQKYKLVNFSFEVLEVCDPGERRDLEKLYIDIFQSKDRDKGYNINK